MLITILTMTGLINFSIVLYFNIKWYQMDPELYDSTFVYSEDQTWSFKLWLYNLWGILNLLYFLNPYI